jgi:hypothetical protein
MGVTANSFFEFLLKLCIPLSEELFVFGSFMGVEPISELKNSGGIMFNAVGLDATLAARDVILDITNIVFLFSHLVLLQYPHV